MAVGPVVLGLVVGLIGTMIGSFAKIFLKKAHNVERDNGPVSLIRFNRGLGVAGMIVNPLVDLLAFAVGTTSVVSVTAGPSVLFNLMLAPFVLNEKWSQLDVLGAVIVTIGMIGVTLSANDDPPPITEFAQVYDLFLTVRFQYFALGFGIWGALLVLSMTQGTLWSKLAWGALGGTVGGLFFLAKCLTTFFQFGTDPWVHWQSYVISSGALLSPLAGAILMNAALARYDAMYVVPTYQALLVLIGATSGVIFFDEYSGMTVENCVIFGLSVFATMMGIVCCLYANIVANKSAPAYEILEPSGFKLRNSVADEGF
jgi:hypothetical protein